MALAPENPFEVFSLGNINPCNFRSGVSLVSGTQEVQWKSNKVVRKPKCRPPVIRMPCVHPHEVKRRLFNEDPSHFNCLCWKAKKRRKSGRARTNEREGGICVALLQMQFVKVMRRWLGENYSNVWTVSQCAALSNRLCVCLFSVIASSREVCVVGSIWLFVCYLVKQSLRDFNWVSLNIMPLGYMFSGFLRILSLVRVMHILKLAIQYSSEVYRLKT